jgi:hypothetical protein
VDNPRQASGPRHAARLGLLAVCGLLLVGAVSGCTTTQETAAKKQAESKRFLEEREKRHAKKQADKSRRSREKR